MSYARNPQAEAQKRLGDQYLARVLEPSPPTSQDTTWYSDHPPAAGNTDGRPVVSPVSAGDKTWNDLIATDTSLADFARDHWLGSFKRIERPSAETLPTVQALLQVAFFVLSPVRQAATGKIALRYTHGGFGTPFFGDDEQVRVDGTTLIHQVGDDVRSMELTTLGAAAEFLGIEPHAPVGIDFHDQPAMVEPSASLAIDQGVAAFVGDWFGFGYLVLEELWVRAGSPEDTRVQLWTEHFDPAIELGSAEAGQRASFGASPGDEGHGEPYLYISPWSPQEGDFWSDPVFGGASLTLTELLAADDQVAAALTFFETGHRILTGG